MFRDDDQLARACRALLAQGRLQRLWTRRGPTGEAKTLLQDDGGPLSSGERILLLAAWAFWNGEGGLRLAEIVQQLDARPTGVLCALMVALQQGAAAVDEWLDAYGIPDEPEVH